MQRPRAAEEFGDRAGRIVVVTDGVVTAGVDALTSFHAEAERQARSRSGTS